MQANGYNNEDAAGIVIKANEVVVIGTQSLYNSHLLIYSINKSTGDTLQTKMLQLLDTPFQKIGVYSDYRLQLLGNGDIALSFKQFGQYSWSFLTPAPLYQGGVVILDNNLDFKNGYCFRNNIESNVANSHITIHPDGSGLFTMLNRQGGYSGETYITQFKDGVILKQRVRSFSNEGYPWENETIQFDNSADLMVQTVGDSITNKTTIVFTKLHLTDTSSACLGRETNATFVEPLHFGYEGYAYLDSIRTSIFLPRRPRTLFQTDISLNKPTFLCNQTSVCDTLKLLSNTDTTCPQIPIIISCRKNPLCGSIVQFNYDTTAVQSFSWMNDSTYQVVFRTGWRGYLKGSLPGCTIHTDSVLLTILQAPASLNIGPDTSICPGNLLLLNAHAGYASYQWQDGSNDSSFTVTSPGTYFVKVMNACGDFFNDTVIVAAHAPIAFSLGNDTTICNNETVTIIAPAGFISYQWSPAYNISQTTGSTVTVSPVSNTVYSVKAEKTPGCFAYDTISVTVKIAPPVNLGPDKNFCNGDSALLNAGASFALYQWSNGSVAQQIYVYTAADYSVIATTLDGCKSYDTLRIQNVWANPTLNLDHNPNLCIGSTRMLQPGNYATYIWQDGSGLPAFTISAPGTYYVTVTDSHQCQGSDTVRILTLLPLPAKFLPADTAICSYDEIVITASQVFSSYVWSTGETGTSIAIKQPGIYWLLATDHYACTGKDSVTVLWKECLKGLYVPTAFSPNKDGKNDVFKPLIFGNVVQFEWTIYNRYGQPVFTTHNPAQGWDGTVKRVPQNSAGFIWQCRYQLEGEKMKFKSGSVVLVR